MQRTYSKRALKRQSTRTDVDDAPSAQRKRAKVYVEIISPRTNRTRQVPDTHKTGSGSPSALMSGSPKTPQKSDPRDSHTVTPRARGSVVKRMLGRSRTDPSIAATPSTETPLANTPRTQISRNASSHSLPTAFPEREPTPEASSHSSPKPLPTRNIRTYAGSSRSFLVSLPVPDAGSSNAVEDDTELHESYTDLRNRWGIDLSEDDPQPSQEGQAAAPAPLRRNPSEISQSFLPAGMMNDLKSITELRSKGESRRFMDEVGYLFEGLDSSSAIGLRRASALEVVNKLSDPDFNRRAKTSDFYIRTWEKFWAARAGTSDKVLDATIAFFAALATRDVRTLTEVAQQKQFIPTLVEILSYFDHRKDVLASVLADTSDDDLKSLGILRAEITALKSLARLVSRESEPSSVNQPSARFFVSLSLATLPPSLLSDQHLPTLLANLRAELDLLQPRITAYESGLPMFPPTSIHPSNIPSLCHIEACLRLLDSYLLGYWSSTDPSGDRSSNALSHVVGFAPELISLCVVSSTLLEGGGDGSDVARRCLCGAMRVLTLLSHDNQWWCDAALDVPGTLAFATTTTMRSQARWSQVQDRETSSPMSSSNSVQAFDLLCLALGLVMNWATLSPRVAALARTQSIDPSCHGSRLCVRTCRCPDQTSILESLTALHVQYTDHHSHGDDDPPECAFLRGYTAILLGLLIKDEPANQAVVTSALPGASPSDGIKALVVHCRAFLDLYDDPTPLSSSPDLPRAATPEATTHEATGRHPATWDKRGEEIARDVIASLETLCDIT